MPSERERPNKCRPYCIAYGEFCCARHSWAAFKRFTVHRIDSPISFFVSSIPFFYSLDFSKIDPTLSNRFFTFFLHTSSLQNDLWAVCIFGIAIAATDQLCQIDVASMEFYVCVWYEWISFNGVQHPGGKCRFVWIFSENAMRKIFQGPTYRFNWWILFMTSRKKQIDCLYSTEHHAKC